jgi:DNA-binding protein YbaB
MAATSIHYSPVKPSSESHNNREKKLDYVRSDLSHLNEKVELDTIANRLSELKLIIKAKTGRKMQDKATPIREAVVVVKENTTMNDLKRLADEFRNRWGIDTFQIHLHKDEGHWRNGEWKPNYHAHFVTDFIDHKTGKSIKLNRQDMAEMQTITAAVLGMERGSSSDKKHLNAIQFKIKAEQERLKSIENEIKEAKELLKIDFKPRKNIFGAYKRSEVETLLKTLKMAQNEIDQAHNKLNKLEYESTKQLRELSGQVKQLRTELNSMKAINRKLITDESYYKSVRDKFLKEKGLNRDDNKMSGGLGL